VEENRGDLFEGTVLAFCSEVLSKTKISCQQSPGRDLNPVSPESEAGIPNSCNG
jgi:hypothetical protein